MAFLAYLLSFFLCFCSVFCLVSNIVSIMTAIYIVCPKRLLVALNHHKQETEILQMFHGDKNLLFTFRVNPPMPISVFRVSISEILNSYSPAFITSLIKV